MPARLIRDSLKCCVCGESAAFKVINHYDDPVGCFCKKHGNQRVKELNEGEKGLTSQ